VVSGEKEWYSKHPSVLSKHWAQSHTSSPQRHNAWDETGYSRTA